MSNRQYTSGPRYAPRHHVLLFKLDSRVKISTVQPQFVGSFPIAKVVNPVADCDS